LARPPAAGRASARRALGVWVLIRSPRRDEPTTDKEPVSVEWGHQITSSEKEKGRKKTKVALMRKQIMFSFYKIFYSHIKF